MPAYRNTLILQNQAGRFGRARGTINLAFNQLKTMLNYLEGTPHAAALKVKTSKMYRRLSRIISTKVQREKRAPLSRLLKEVSRHL